MRFSQDFIEKVRDANNIVEIIAQHTQLRQMGDRYSGICPFPDHKERTPSFSVSESKQLYYCFGCKKAGNIFTFLETHDGLSFPDALEYLARRRSIPMPENENDRDNGQGKDRQMQKQTLLKVNKIAGAYYFRQLGKLTEDHPARLYLRKRGLDVEVTNKFRLGVAQSGWEDLANHFNAQKAPLAAAETLGLIRKRKASQQTGYYDQFRERILFPIFSPTNEVVGFGGRTYSEGVPKYLNSPESPIFAKGRVLYGLHETGKYIRSEDRAIVVEGYMDLLTLYAAGICNVAAALGTAFTPDHARLLGRYSQQVTMLFDGDEAGQTAAERALPILLRAGLMPRGCFLPGGLDPDDYLRANGIDALKAQLDGAPELFRLVLDRWMQDYRGQATEKVQLAARLAPILNSITNPQLRDLYIMEVASRLDVAVQWVMRTLQSTSPSAGVAVSESGTAAQLATETVSGSATDGAAEKISVKGAPRDESFLFSLLLNREPLLKAAMDSGVIEFFTHEGLRKLLLTAFEKYGQRPELFDKLPSSLASQIDAPGILAGSLEIIQDMDKSEEQKLMSEYVNGMRKRHFANLAKNMARQFREQPSPEKLEQKLEQFMNIQRDRLALGRTPESGDKGGEL